MKMLKHLAVASISMVLLTAGFLVGCKKDNSNTKPQTYCDTAHCGAGTCDSATRTCLCPDGYEGYGCATEVRARMVGTYLSADQCVPSAPYTVTVTTSTQGAKFITISNLINEGYTVTAKLSSGQPGSDYTNITIDQQNANGNSGPAVITGSGEMLQNGHMTLTYTIQLSGTTGNCVLTGAKQ